MMHTYQADKGREGEAKRSCWVGRHLSRTGCSPLRVSGSEPAPPHAYIFTYYFHGCISSFTFIQCYRRIIFMAASAILLSCTSTHAESEEQATKLDLQHTIPYPLLLLLLLLLILLIPLSYYLPPPPPPPLLLLLLRRRRLLLLLLLLLLTTNTTTAHLGCISKPTCGIRSSIYYNYYKYLLQELIVLLLLLLLILLPAHTCT